MHTLLTSLGLLLLTAFGLAILARLRGRGPLVVATAAFCLVTAGLSVGAFAATLGHPVLAQASSGPIAFLLSLVPWIPAAWQPWIVGGLQIAFGVVTVASLAANKVSPSTSLGRALHVLALNGPNIQNAITSAEGVLTGPSARKPAS